MINVYIHSSQALFYVWIFCAILGLVEREASSYAGLLMIPSFVDAVNTRFFVEEYTPQKRVAWNLDELALFIFVQLTILYVISPFRTYVEILLFLLGVYQLGSLYYVSERFHHCIITLLFLCGSVTVIFAVLCGSCIVECSPYMTIPCLVYSTYLANSITLEDTDNPEELEELL